MRKEKNFKILPLILAAFILVLIVSGCRTNEGASSEILSSSTSSETAQSKAEVSSEIAVSEPDSVTISSNISKTESISSGKETEQSSSSKQMVSENNSSKQTASKSTASKQAAWKNSSTAVHTHTFKTEKSEATCIVSGYIKKTCACGESSYERINALGHDLGEWKITKQPTATSEGQRKRVCSRCKYEAVETLGKLSAATSNEQLCQEVFRLVNEERAKAGLSALTYYTAGQAAANKRADEIQTLFSHTRPNGTTCFTVFDEFGLTGFRWYAENIAMGQISPAQVMNSWMNSEGHRANILSPNATGITIGVKNNHWVQLFVGA